MQTHLCLERVNDCWRVIRRCKQHIFAFVITTGRSIESCGMSSVRSCRLNTVNLGAEKEAKCVTKSHSTFKRSLLIRCLFCSTFFYHFTVKQRSNTDAAYVGVYLMYMLKTVISGVHLGVLFEESLGVHQSAAWGCHPDSFHFIGFWQCETVLLSRVQLVDIYFSACTTGNIARGFGKLFPLLKTLSLITMTCEWSETHSTD